MRGRGGMEWILELDRGGQKSLEASRYVPYGPLIVLKPQSEDKYLSWSKREMEKKNNRMRAETKAVTHFAQTFSPLHPHYTRESIPFTRIIFES